MSKWISVDELIEYCDTERSMLNAHNGGNGVACAALRRVVDFVKEYAVETEPNKGWVSVKDRLPDEDGKYLVCGKLALSDIYGEPIQVVRFAERKEWFTSLSVKYWMPLPQKPKSEDDAK